MQAPGSSGPKTQPLRILSQDISCYARVQGLRRRRIAGLEPIGLFVTALRHFPCTMPLPTDLESDITRVRL